MKILKMMKIIGSMKKNEITKINLMYENFYNLQIL